MGQIISTDWKEENICDICNVYQPKTISSDALLPNGKYTVFGANGIIGKYNDYNHEKPEILVTCRGATCGSINKSLPFSWINGNAMVVSPKNEEILSKSYLYYFLIATNFSRFITGTAQPQITRAGLSPLKIVYPSLSEQQRIVEKLDTLFADIEKEKQIAQQNLQNAKELFESKLHKLFTENTDWKEENICDICNVYQPKTISSDALLPNGKYTVFGANGIIGKYNDYNHEKPEILVTCRGATCGSINKSLPFSWINGNAMVVSPKNEEILSKSYLYYFLIATNFSRFITGTAQPQITRAGLSPLKIVYPSLSEQQRIVEKLDALQEQTQELEQIYTQQIADLDELKQAILKKAFNGEL